MAYLLTTLLAFVVYPSVAMAQGLICPEGDYQMSEDQRYCYRYEQTPTDYLTANQRCVREGGSLVYIETNEENSEINNNYFANRGSTEFWIGLDDLEEEGTFRWTDPGIPLMYTNWAGGNQNTAQNTGGWDCTKFSTSGLWVVHDGFCGTSHLPYLCKTRTTSAPQSISTEVIAAVVVVLLLLITLGIVIVLVPVCVVYCNDTVQRYLCCCVGGKKTSIVNSLQQENVRLRRQLSENKVAVSGRFSHAGELSGVPDGRGGVLPTIKQIPSVYPLTLEERSLSVSRNRPPPLILSQPGSKVTPARGMTTPINIVPTPLFISGQARPTRQSAPGVIGHHLPSPKLPVTVIPEVKGHEEDSDSSGDEFFKREEGIADPRVTKKEEVTPIATEKKDKTVATESTPQV